MVLNQAYDDDQPALIWLQLEQIIGGMLKLLQCQLTHQTRGSSGQGSSIGGKSRMASAGKVPGEMLCTQTTLQGNGRGCNIQVAQVELLWC